jgi:hypothetical protein
MLSLERGVPTLKVGLLRLLHLLGGRSWWVDGHMRVSGWAGAGRIGDERLMSGRQPVYKRPGWEGY